MSSTGRKRARSTERRIRLHFLGAARTVTGSLHLFEYSDNGRTVRFFIDAGLNQESPGQNFQNRLPAGVKASDLSFGIFTHAHIDHTGFFPRLIKDGFKGVVYATHATRDLTAILLPDSGFLQEQDAKRVNARNDRQQAARAANPKTPAAKAKKKPSRHAAAPAPKAPVAVRRVEPLYTEAEGKSAIQRIVGVDYDKPLNLAEGVVATFSHASHLLGAAVVSLEIGTGSKKRRIVFTGDLGRPGMPIIKNLAPVKQADYLISEGTYGDKLHERRDRQTAFAEVIRQAYERAKRPDGKYVVAQLEVSYDVGATGERETTGQIPLEMTYTSAGHGYINAEVARHIDEVQIFEMNNNLQQAIAKNDQQAIKTVAEQIEKKGEVMGKRAAKKTMLAKQVLQELNVGGRALRYVYFAAAHLSSVLQLQERHLSLGGARHRKSHPRVRSRPLVQSIRRRSSRDGFLVPVPFAGHVLQRLRRLDHAQQVAAHYH